MCVLPKDIPQTFSKDYSIRYDVISDISHEELMLRYGIILLLNKKLERVIHMVDLINDTNSQSLGHKLSEISFLIFIHTKEEVLEECILLTEVNRPEHETIIELNNHLAFVSMEKSHRLNKPLDALSSECMFTQVYKYIFIIYSFSFFSFFSFFLFLSNIYYMNSFTIL